MHTPLIKAVNRIKLFLKLAAVTAGILLPSCGTSMQPSDVTPIVDGEIRPCRGTTGVVSAGDVAQGTGRGTASGVNYAGTWTGQYRVTGCVIVCGSGSSVCKTLIPGGGARFGLRITLTQDGATVSGTVDLFDNTGGVMVETGQVAGVVDDSDVLALSGNTVTADPRESNQSTLTGWRTTLTNDGSNMTGRFTKNWSFRNAFGAQQLKLECELLNVQRSKS